MQSSTRAIVARRVDLVRIEVHLRVSQRGSKLFHAVGRLAEAQFMREQLRMVGREGSGRCGHRMRGILFGRPAALKLWPSVRADPALHMLQRSVERKGGGSWPPRIAL